MHSSPTVVMGPGGRGRPAATGAFLVAALVALAALLMAGAAYGAAEAKPKPKPKVVKKAKAKKAKPKVRAQVKNKLLTVTGTSRGETIALRLRARYPNRLQVDVGNNRSAEWQFNRSTFNRIVVRAGFGNDLVLIDESRGVFTNTEATSLFGEYGNDRLRGGSGAERFYGGRDKDAVDGNRGNDLAFLGAGDDSFTWDPGDGSDRVEGEAGTDTMLFNGAAVNESFELAANGPRLRFTRDVASITMDVAGTERFLLEALGGADKAVVNDLAGTGVNLVDIDLEGTPNGGAGDGQSDTIEVKGSAAGEVVRVANAIDVTGLAAAIHVSRAEAANDKLNVDPGAGVDRITVAGSNGTDTMAVAAAAAAGHVSVTGGPVGVPIDLVGSESLTVESLGGEDTISAGLGLAALIQLTLDGGAGNDAINGGDGADLILGGTENDAVDGNRGDDTAFLGAGDDSFTWDPGDGSDKVEGEAGTDTMVFNGAGVAENFDFSANGNRLRFFRNVANITMDVDDTERVDLRALGGIDNTVVNDLSATDVKNIELDLETAIGGGAGDGAADTITVNGTAGNDTIAIAPNAGAVEVTGLAAAVKIEHSEAANDLLTVNGLGGNDTISGAIGLAALIKVAIDGGDGNDTINGGDGAETLTGGNGNDAVDGNRGDDTGFLGAGDDSFRWDPGDGSDVVEGQDGTDTLLFNGAGAAENFDVSANGQRVKFFRDVANITMDLNDTERIDVQALGGADNAVVNDVTGTDLTSVELDLEAAIGGGAGDGAADSVTANGTAGNDTISVTASGSAVNVAGLPAAVNLDHSEAANDKLTVNGLAGADTITAATLPAATVKLTLDGGPGADTIRGGQGADVLLGGSEADDLDGNQGNDVAFLGSEDDAFTWDPGDGSDTVEGQAGTDTMVFNGSGGAENFTFTANGPRLTFFRNLGNITMDVDDTERVDLRALGGADTAVVNDLTGTDVAKANIDLAGVIGGAAGDGAADAITVNGTDGADSIAVAANGAAVDATGLFTAVTITNSEAANDSLAINGLGGDDDITVGGDVAALIQTLVDPGAGE